MFSISLLLILSTILKNDSCSLLSRLKNRYEYITQENNFNIVSDDVYDFEYTTTYLTKRTRFDTYDINAAEEISYDTSSDSGNYHANESIYDPALYTRSLITFKKPGEEYNTSSVSPEDVPVYIIRPTMNPKFILTDISSRKHRKTWPTYFPRNTLSSSSPLRESAETPTNMLPILRDMKKIALYPKIVIKEHTDETTKVSDVTTIKLEINETTTEFNEHIVTSSASTAVNRSVIPTPTSQPETSHSSKTSAATTTNTVKSKLVKSSCYMCGLNETRIPTPNCYNIFDGDDQRYGRLKHRFKVKCIFSDSQKTNKNVYYGPTYRGGCFKRFLDVGVEYNERGCRTFEPSIGKSFASIRFSKMELLLNDSNDDCVFSPHASITPFSRAVSLFARYHVCVCSQKYCNQSIVNSLNSYILLILIVDTIYI